MQAILKQGTRLFLFSSEHQTWRDRAALNTHAGPRATALEGADGRSRNEVSVETSAGALRFPCSLQTRCPDHKAGGKSLGRGGFQNENKIPGTVGAKALLLQTLPPPPRRGGHSPTREGPPFSFSSPHPSSAPQGPFCDASSLFISLYMAAFDVHFNQIKICGLWPGSWG